VNPKDRIANNLVALGSAAVFTVYAAGYLRTRSAAQRFAVESSERRPAGQTGGVPMSHVSAPATIADVVPVPPASVTPAPKKASPLAPAKGRTPKPATTTAPRVAASSAPTPDSMTPAPTPAPATVPAAAAPTVVASRDSSTAATANRVADSTAKADKEKAPWKDGLYFGWGTSRHGDIQAGVEIKNGRIASAFISECLTQYSCSWVSLLPPQVVARQSAEVDFVSGATQSANAFYYAVVDALKKAK